MTKSGQDDGDRLRAALAERGLADPRPSLRERLRALRDGNPAAFEEAKARFESIVQDGDATRDTVEAWVEYGRYLGDLTGPGTLYAVDAGGRAVPWAPPPAPGILILHIPDETGAPALAVMAPTDPSPAQQATLDLLVGRRLAL